VSQYGWGTCPPDVRRQVDRLVAGIGIFHCSPSLGPFYAASGWIPMAGVTSWVGPKSAPVASDELLMMLFLSDKGRRGRPAFEREPLYFGEYTW
jgi:hypothetical protein